MRQRREARRGVREAGLLLGKFQSGPIWSGSVEFICGGQLRSNGETHTGRRPQIRPIKTALSLLTAIKRTQMFSVFQQRVHEPKFLRCPDAILQSLR